MIDLFATKRITSIYRLTCESISHAHPIPSALWSLSAMLSFIVKRCAKRFAWIFPMNSRKCSIYKEVAFISRCVCLWLIHINSFQRVLFVPERGCDIVYIFVPDTPIFSLCQSNAKSGRIVWNFWSFDRRGEVWTHSLVCYR